MPPSLRAALKYARASAVFCQFDHLLLGYLQGEVTKIESVQNCYIAVSGCPTQRSDHALVCLQAALQVCPAPIQSTLLGCMFAACFTRVQP